MFDECTTLAELNMARIKAAAESGNIVAINSAYNARRKEILNARTASKHFDAITVTPAEPHMYMTIPIAGRSQNPGIIYLTNKGFLI